MLATHYERNANQTYNDASPHTCQKGYHKKNLETISDEVSWRKENPLAL